MKKLFFIFCMGTLLAISGCIGNQKPSCPEDYFKEFRCEYDDYGNALKWFDIDCDNVCDGAAVFDEDGLPIGTLPCEVADELIKTYNEMKKSQAI